MVPTPAPNKRELRIKLIIRGLELYVFKQEKAMVHASKAGINDTKVSVGSYSIVVHKENASIAIKCMLQTPPARTKAAVILANFR